MPSKSEMAFRDNLILAIVPPLCLQRFQVGIEVEILDIPACFSFLNGSAESCNPLFILFQPSEAGPNHLAGIRIPSSKDTGLDEGVKMRTQCDRCGFHLNLSLLQI